MKKIVLSLTAVALLVATACKKEEQTPREAGAATVKGLVEVNSNTANDTLSDGSAMAMWETAPAGTKLTFIIDGGDLDPNPDPSYDYKDQLYSTSIGSDGTYSVSLPAYETPITAQVRFDDFEVDLIEFGTDPGDTTATGAPATVETRTTFSKASTSVTIYDGAVVVNDYQY
jgi:hypothetical protein